MPLNILNHAKKARRSPVSSITALGEVKLLGLILGEAKERGLVRANVCRGLGIKRERGRIKPEFTDDQIWAIREALANWPEWMRICFEISIHHGTRLRATQIDLLRDIDWENRRITFHEKAGKVFTVPAHLDVFRLLEQRRNAGAQMACELPKGPSKAWRKFFDSIDLTEHCFHCCRVTVISRMARAGVPEAKAMKFVGHASTEIHRIYQRLRAEDLDDCLNALNF